MSDTFQLLRRQYTPRSSGWASPDGVAAYQYYVFLFDIAQTDSLSSPYVDVDLATAVSEAYYAELFPNTYAIQPDILVGEGTLGAGSMYDALAVRFTLHPALDPTAAALLALGAACLGLHRRFRR